MTVESGALDPVWLELERLQGAIAREIRVMLGEEKYDQRIFTEDERARRAHALALCASQDTSDEERHAAWCAMHLEQGWKYGPEFKPSEKEHPNLLPWSELPKSTRSKAKIFDIVAKAGKRLAVR